MLRRVVTPVAAAVAAASAVGSATCTPTRGIYEYRFGQTPLSKPFTAGGASSPNLAPQGSDAAQGSAPATAPKVEVTRLHNGARVISQNFGGPLVSVGAYILAGPAYDPAGCPGVAAMMHLALTTSNYNNSLFQLDRNLRSVGAAESHFEKNKHYIGIRVDSRADKWKAEPATTAAVSGKGGVQPFALNLVQDNIFTCIAAPRFHETDIERFRDTIDNQLKELKWQYPAAYAIQMLETVAFYREPLGSPRFVPEQNNGSISSKVLLDQYSRYIVPSRVVIAGVNVKHADLIAEYENTPFPHSATAPHHAKVLAESANQPAPKPEESQYTGGERQDHEDRAKDMGTKPDMDTETICAVGWLAYGRDRLVLKDYAASLVMQQIMEMEMKNSLRYNQDETHVHEGVRTFYNPYNTAGLIGFTVTAEPQNAVKMVTDTAKLVQGKKNIGEAELSSGKARAAVQFVNEATDNIRDYCDYLGTSLPQDPSLTTPVRVEEVEDAIRAVTAADLKRVHDCMLSHPTSFYGHGEMLGFPSVRQMGL